MVLLRTALATMGISFFTERFGVGIERAEDPPEVSIVCPQFAPLFAQGARVGRFHRPKAAVTATLIGWTDRATAGLRHGAKAGHPSGHHHTRIAPLFAFETHAVFGRVRFC